MSVPASGPASGPVNESIEEEEDDSGFTSISVSDRNALTAPKTVSLSGPVSGPISPTVSGPAPKKYKYGLTDQDSPGGQVQLYKSMLLPYNPTLGNSLGYPYNVDAVENCILWIDLSDIRSTRPNDSAELDNIDSLVSKLSGKSPTTLPMFIYMKTRNILHYNKSSGSLTLPKGNIYSLRTPPVSFSSSQAGGGPSAPAPVTESYESFIDRATIVAADSVKTQGFKKFNKLIDLNGYPLYTTSLPGTLDVSNNIIWIPQNPIKPLTGTGWMFNAPLITNVVESDSIVLYKISQSINASKYGYLHNMDMSGFLKADITAANRSLSDLSYNNKVTYKSIEDLSSQYVELRRDLSNQYQAILNAKADIEEYTKFFYDTFTVVFEYNATTKRMEAIEFNTKYAQQIAEHERNLEGYKDTYQRYLTDFSTRHKNHGYIKPNISSSTGFTAYLEQYIAQNRIINIGRNAYLDYTKAKYDIDMDTYSSDMLKYRQKGVMATHLTNILSELKRSPYSVYGINDFTRRPFVTNTDFPKLNLADICIYTDVSQAWVTNLISRMNAYLYSDALIDLQAEAAIVYKNCLGIAAQLKTSYDEYVLVKNNNINQFYTKNYSFDGFDFRTFEIGTYNIRPIYPSWYKLINDNPGIYGVNSGNDRKFYEGKGLFGELIPYIDLTRVEILQAEYNKYTSILKDIDALKILIGKNINLLSLYMRIKDIKRPAIDFDSMLRKRSFDTTIKDYEWISSVINNPLFSRQRAENEAHREELKNQAFVFDLSNAVTYFANKILSSSTVTTSGARASGAITSGARASGAITSGPRDSGATSSGATASETSTLLSKFSEALSAASGKRDEVDPSLEESYTMLDTAIKIITNTESQPFIPPSMGTAFVRHKGDVTKRFWKPDSLKTPYKAASDAFLNIITPGTSHLAREDLSQALFLNNLPSSYTDSFISEYEQIKGAATNLFSFIKDFINRFPQYTGMTVNNAEIDSIIPSIESDAGKLSFQRNLYYTVKRKIDYFNANSLGFRPDRRSIALNNLTDLYNLYKRSIDRIKTLTYVYTTSRTENWSPPGENTAHIPNTTVYSIDGKMIETNSLNRGILQSVFTDLSTNLISLNARLQEMGLQAITITLGNKITVQKEVRQIYVTREGRVATVREKIGNMYSVNGILVNIKEKVGVINIDVEGRVTTVTDNEISVDFGGRTNNIEVQRSIPILTADATVNYSNLINVDNFINGEGALKRQLTSIKEYLDSFNIIDSIYANENISRLYNEAYKISKQTFINSLSTNISTGIKKVLYTRLAYYNEYMSYLTPIIDKVLSNTLREEFPYIRTICSLLMNAESAKIDAVNAKSDMKDMIASGSYNVKVARVRLLLSQNKIYNSAPFIAAATAAETAANNIRSTARSSLQMPSVTTNILGENHISGIQITDISSNYILSSNPNTAKSILYDIEGIIHAEKTKEETINKGKARDDPLRYTTPLNLDLIYYRVSDFLVISPLYIYDIAKMSEPVRPPPPYAPFNQPGIPAYESIKFRYREGDLNTEDTLEYWYPDSQTFPSINDLNSNIFNSMIPEEYSVATSMSPWADELTEVMFTTPDKSSIRGANGYEVNLPDFSLTNGLVHRPLRYRPAWLKSVSKALSAGRYDFVTRFNILQRDLTRFNSDKYKSYIQQYLNEDSKIVRSNKWNPEPFLTYSGSDQSIRRSEIERVTQLYKPANPGRAYISYTAFDEFVVENDLGQWKKHHNQAVIKNIKVLDRQISPRLNNPGQYKQNASTLAEKTYSEFETPPTWWKLMEVKYRVLYYLEKDFNSGRKQEMLKDILKLIQNKRDAIANNNKLIIDYLSAARTAERNFADPSMRYQFKFFKLNEYTEVVRNNPITISDMKHNVVTPLYDFFSRGIRYSPLPNKDELAYYVAQLIFRSYIQANDNGIKPSQMVSKAKNFPRISTDLPDQTTLPNTFMNLLKNAETSPTRSTPPPIDYYSIDLAYFLISDGGDENSIPVPPSSKVETAAPVFTSFIAINGYLTNSNYSISDTFDDYEGNYMNPEGRVLVNSPLLSYHRELQRIVLRSTVEMDLVINEILVFNRVLSASEIDTIVSYLSYKWVCMKYMPITSRFFPDNYRSNYDSMMLDMRKTIYNSMYNLLDPILSSLNTTSYTKANKTGNPLTYFIENTKITSEYVTSYVNDTMNQAYIYRDTTLMNVIQRYRQLFRYLTKAAITYIPPTRINTIPPVDPDSNLEIINLKAAAEAIKNDINIVEASSYRGYMNTLSKYHPEFVTNSPYASVLRLRSISFLPIKENELLEYFRFSYNKVINTRPYKGPDSEFATSIEILTESAARVYFIDRIDAAYNMYYQMEKDKQTAVYNNALKYTVSIVSPSFAKHVNDICAIENRSSNYIIDEKAELDGLTGKMDTFFKSLWTIPDNLAKLAADLEQKAEEAKQAAIMVLKNGVRTEIALENANRISTRIASISSVLSKNRSDLQSLRDIAVKNSQYVYDDLSANILGQLLSDFNEIMSEGATSILGDFIFNMNGLTIAAKYDRELIELFSTYDLAPDPSILTYKGQPFRNYLATLDPEYEQTISGTPYGKNGQPMNVSPRAVDITFVQTYKSIDMTELTILQAMIVKYTKIFNTLITGLAKGTLPLYNIHLYIYYLTNYLSDIKYISDTILDKVMSLTPKVVSMLKLIPGKIDEGRFKGSLVEIIEVINKTRSLPMRNVMSGGGASGPASGSRASGPASGPASGSRVFAPVVSVAPLAPNLILGPSPLSLPFIFDGFTFDTESDLESYLEYNPDYPIQGTIWASNLDRSARQLSYITDYTLVGHWYKAFILNTYNVIKNFELSLNSALKEILNKDVIEDPKELAELAARQAAEKASGSLVSGPVGESTDINMTPVKSVENNKRQIESYITDLEKSGKLPSGSLNQYKAFLVTNTNAATASAELSALGIYAPNLWSPSTAINPSKSSTFARCENIMNDISNTVLNILLNTDPMQTLMSLKPKFEMKYPSHLYPTSFRLASLLISDMEDIISSNGISSNAFATASRKLVDARNSIAEYSALIKPNIASRKFPENIKEMIENIITNIESVINIDIEEINRQMKPLKIEIPANFYDVFNNALSEIVKLNDDLTTSGYYSQLEFSKGINALPRSEVIQKYVKSRYIKKLNPVQSKSLGIPFILVDSSGNPADGNGNTLAAGALYTPIDPYVEFMTLSSDGLYYYYDYNNPTLKGDIAKLAALQSDLNIAQQNLFMNVANVISMYDSRDRSINLISGDNSYQQSQISVINLRYPQLFSNGRLIPQQEYIEQSRIKREAELAVIQQQVNAQLELIGTARYNNALNLRYYLKGSFTENLKVKLFPKLLFRPFKDIMIPQQIDASGHILIDATDKNSILLINAGFYFQGVELPRAGLDTGDYYILSNNTSYPLFVHVPNAASTTRTMIPPKGVAQYSYSLTKTTSFYGFTLMTDIYLPDILRGVPRTGTVATVTEWNKTVFVDYIPRFTEYTVSPTSDSSGCAIDVVIFEQKDGSSVYYDSDDVNRFLPIPVRNLGKMSLNDMKLDKSFKIEQPPKSRVPSIYFLENPSSSIRILCSSKGEIAFDVNGDMKTVPGPLYASSTTLYYQDMPNATVYPVAVGTYTGYTSFSPTVSTEYLYRTPFCMRWVSATGPYVFCSVTGHILIDSVNKPILLPGLRASSNSDQILAMKSQSVRATYYESQTMVQSSGPSGALINASPPRYCVILQNDQIKNNEDIITRTPPEIVNNEPVSTPLTDITDLMDKRDKKDINNTLYYRFKAVIRIILLLKATYSSGSMMSGASSVFSEIQKNTPNIFQQIQEGIVTLNATYTQLSSDIQTVDTLFRKNDTESYAQLLAFAQKAEGALQDLISKVSFSEIMSTYAYYKIAVKEAADVNINIVRILGQIQSLHANFSRVVASLIQAQTYLTPEEVVTYTKIPLAPIDSRLSNLNVNAQIVPVYISNLNTATTSAGINQYLHSIYRVQTIATSSLFAVNGYLSISGDHINLLRAELVSLLSTKVQDRQSAMLSLLETAKNPTVLDIALQTYSPETYTKLQGFKTTIDGAQINLTADSIRAFASTFSLGDLNSTTRSYTAYISATRGAFEKLTLIDSTQKQMAAYYKEVIPSVITPLAREFNIINQNILTPIKTITDTIESTRVIVERYKLNTSPILYTVEQTSVILDIYNKLKQAYLAFTSSYSGDLTKLPNLIENAVFSDMLVYYTRQPTDRTKAITAAVQGMAAQSFSLTTYLQSFTVDNTQTLLSSAATLRKSVLNQKSQFDKLFVYITTLLRSIGVSEWRKSIMPFINQLHFTRLYASYITSILKSLVRVDMNSSTDILMTTVTSLRKNADIYTNLLNMMYSCLETIFARISALPLPRLIAVISPLPTRSPDTDLDISVMNDVAGGIYPENVLPHSSYYALYDSIFVPYMAFYKWVESYKPVMDAILRTASTTEVPVIYSIYDLRDSLGTSFEACITNGLFGQACNFLNTLDEIRTNINAATCSLFGLLWKRISQIVQYNKIPSDVIKTVLTDLLNLQDSVENQIYIIQYYTVFAGLFIDDSAADATARLRTIGTAVSALNITTKPETTQHVTKSLSSILPLPIGKSFIGETTLEQKMQWLFTNREVREKKSIDLRSIFLKCIMYDIFKYKVRFVPAIFSVIVTEVHADLIKPNIFDGKRVYVFFDTSDTGADQADLPVTLTKIVGDMFPKDLESFSKSTDPSIFSTIDLYSKQLLGQNTSLTAFFQILDDLKSFMLSYTDEVVTAIVEAYYPSIYTGPRIQSPTGTPTQGPTGTPTQGPTTPAIQDPTSQSTAFTPYDPSILWDPPNTPHDAMSDQTGGSYTIPYQYENPHPTSISKVLSSLYNEYLTESAKNPPNFYSVKLIIDSYSDAISNKISPSAAETNINATLSTSVAGKPIYSAYTNTNKYDLTYLSGIPDAFKIQIPSGTYSKEHMNYWIYFINTIFTEADAFLKVIEVKGLADTIAYDRKKLTNVGNPSSDIQARASDKARAVSLLRTPVIPVDLPGPNLGPNTTSGPPAPRMTGGYTPLAPPPGSGPLLYGAGAVSIPGPSLHGKIL